MNNARREGTVYGDSWKKGVDEAFAVAKTNASGENFNSMFTDFKVINHEPLPGFRRFEFASAISNHPSFKEGQLYAIPLRDGNKSVHTEKGVITIHPESGVPLTYDVVSRLMETAIEEDLDGRGLLTENLALGAFARDAFPVDFKRGEKKQSLRTSFGKHHFVLFHGDEIVETLSVGYDEVGEGKDAFAVAMSAALKKMPEYYPGLSPLDSQQFFTLCEIESTGVSVLEHLTEITYAYTARLYDVSGEPDGWGFFGIPIK